MSFVFNRSIIICTLHSRRPAQLTYQLDSVFCFNNLFSIHLFDKTALRKLHSHKYRNVSSSIRRGSGIDSYAWNCTTGFWRGVGTCSRIVYTNSSITDRCCCCQKWKLISADLCNLMIGPPLFTVSFFLFGGNYRSPHGRNTVIAHTRLTHMFQYVCVLLN